MIVGNSNAVVAGDRSMHQ